MRLMPAAIAVALAIASLTLAGCRQSGDGDFWKAVSTEVGKQEKK